MLKVNLEVDTGGTITTKNLFSSPDERTLAQLAPPIIFISTVTLTPELKKAFEEGTGNIRTNFFHGKDYDELEHCIETKDKANTLIVTAGGALAFQAAKNKVTKGRFVSLMGYEPTPPFGNCLGGVTLESIKQNTCRVDYLEKKKGRARAHIGLFCNKKSEMNPAEETNWTTISGVDQHFIYGGNTMTGPRKNDASHYLADLQAADAYGITTLVISSDPFFNHTKDRLIEAANIWAGTTKYVCYPLGDYANANGLTQPATGTASWYGPDLKELYNQLGTVAAGAMTGGWQGFPNAITTWGDY